MFGVHLKDNKTAANEASANHFRMILVSVIIKLSKSDSVMTVMRACFTAGGRTWCAASPVTIYYKGGLRGWQRCNYNSNSLERHGSVTHSERRKLKNTRLDSNVMVRVEYEYIAFGDSC